MTTSHRTFPPGCRARVVVGARLRCPACDTNEPIAPAGPWLDVTHGVCQRCYGPALVGLFLASSVVPSIPLRESTNDA